MGVCGKLEGRLVLIVLARLKNVNDFAQGLLIIIFAFKIAEYVCYLTRLAEMRIFFVFHVNYFVYNEMI